MRAIDRSVIDQRWPCGGQSMLVQKVAATLDYGGFASFLTDLFPPLALGGDRICKRCCETDSTGTTITSDSAFVSSSARVRVQMAATSSLLHVGFDFVTSFCCTLAFASILSLRFARLVVGVFASASFNSTYSFSH
eukprot:GHVU01230415.1.p2 GENE.GHVU01230415.1~~GHVU01230415.1.p2  ORF type:complete len:136 (+),score=4.70 GHVU01230415.1:743-1150(+)